ncbi:MAG: threonine-phosphate decarboxylase [Clostridia bacterium]
MTHGGDIYSFEKETGIIPLDFSENTNPLGLPTSVKRAIINSVETFCAYPDLNCTDLTIATALFYDVSPTHLLFGNGAADLIFKIAYCLKPKKAIVLAPTFSEYEIALKNAGADVDYYYLSENFQISDDILDIVENKVVFICNPNNPTGTLCDTTLLKKIAQKAQYLIIDECFMDFVCNSDKYSLLSEINNYPNIIILKAFTKIFSMAGLRLGFCVSSNVELLHNINSQGQPWSVSTVAQVAGIACFEESDFVSKTQKLILTERSYLQNELNILGFEVYQSSTNYILFKTPIELQKSLKSFGIMIRLCSNYIGLNDNYYRIAVRSHEENLRLINTLNIIVKNDKKLSTQN